MDAPETQVAAAARALVHGSPGRWPVPASDSSTSLVTSDVAEHGTEILAETQRILAVLRRLRLLTRNARVESARAGEASFGFAVVAREM